jgi:hypothetical protein
MRSDEEMILQVAITRAKSQVDAKNSEWIVDYNGGIEN